MPKKKREKYDRKVPESEERLKELNLSRKDTNFQNLLRKTGFDFKSVAPKMEEYKSLLKWNEDSFAYMKARVEILKQMAELVNTLGIRGADIMIEIQRISYFIDMLEKELVSGGQNPLENKFYLNALKLKKEMMNDYNKLNIDYGKAVTDYKYKKALHPDMEDDDLFVVQERDNQVREDGKD